MGLDGGDGGYGDGPQNNTSRRFQKRAGGNNVATLEYFKAELTLQGQIYEKCKCIKVAHIDKLRNLIANL